MVVISKGMIHEFAKKNAMSKIPLNNWYAKATIADWKKYSDLKNTFGSADAIGNNRFIFNVGGNNYRIVALIHFSIRTIFIRAILTHSEYNFLLKDSKLNIL